MKRRMIALAMALVMCLSLVPTVAFADGHDGQVRVIVENTTYAKTAGAPWEGTLVNELVTIDNDSTMMSCIVAALKNHNYSQIGAENDYISEINGLAEQAGSYNMSGWMGTLNDWFTNEGFGAFTVANGKLSAGDEIRIMYTLNGGEDCGGSRNNNDKTVKNVTFNAGTLNTTFASDTNDYTLTVPAGTESITVTPTASNKNFQVRTSVNGTEYKRTAAVPVEDGTVITVKCGDPAWPSMNNGAGGAEDVPAQTYTFTVSKPVPAESFTLNKSELTLAVGASETLTVMPVGSTDTVEWSSSNTDIARVDDTGKVTAVAVGTATITATAGEKTATCAVTVGNTFTVNVSPKTANASFFKGADAETALAETAVEDKGQVKVGSYTYHQYVLTVPAGDYSYRGNESGVALGGEQFTVTEDENQTLNLLRANIRYNGASLNHEGDYSFSLKNGESEVVCGEPYLSSSIRYTPALLIAGVEHEGSVTLNGKWLDDYYLTANGNFTTKPSKTATSAATLNLPITAYKIIRVTAPKEAATTFYKQDANYVVESVAPDSSAENEDGTVTYLFKGTAAHNSYQFRSMMAGKVTQAGYLADGNSVTVSFPNRSPASTASSLNYDDNSVLLNINEKNKLHLSVGETFKLRAFRAAWEIINTTTGNQMIEPDFHFAVLSGEGVVSITPTDECSNSKFPNAKNGNATGNWMNVKAENPGTAVVAVWYDAIDVYNANPPAANAFSTFGATDPARYGIFVVTVGEDKNLSWNPVSQDGDWDSEFDTVYYVGDSGEFTFNPGTVSSVTVQNVYGPDLGAVQSVSPNADGSYSVPVKTGANIICADGDYMVVRARQISYTVTNKTTGEAVTNGAPAIKTENTVEISFSKLDMPLPKMSGIYNPAYMGTGKTAYVLNDTYTLTSAGTQYDFSVNNSITFKAHVAGENSLKGYISLSSMGDPFGNHRAISDEGKAMNGNASEVFGSFGVLPDISFTVTDSGASGSYKNATTITKFSVVAGMNSFNMAFNWKDIKDVEAAWNKTAAQVSTFGLIPNVTTADYNNTITFRYWYEGEDVHSLQLVSGVAGNITPADFPLNPDKIMHLQVEVKPIPETLGAPVVYNYLAFPGSGNQTYVHPFIKSLTAKVGKKPVPLPINTVDTNYTLEVGSADKLTLNAVQLVQIYNTATTADCSDRVTLTKLCKGEAVGESITVLEMGLPNNPNRNWTVQDLDITDADALELKVTSYVDESVSRTYHIDLINLMRTSLAVEKIAAIGTVTLESKSAIDAARAAYDALSGAEKEKVTNYAELMEAEAAYANLMAKAAEETAEIYFTAVGDSLLANAEKSTPIVGSIGGEWMILGLARSGKLTDAVNTAAYYQSVVDYVTAAASKARDTNPSTDYSRMILALTAIGKDPTNVGGYDLTAKLGSMSYLNKQGTNGPVWALIALDSHNYAMSGDVTREKLIDTICSAQMESGGWYISDANPVEDVDMTAMAVQALAPYYENNSAAKSAVDKALTWLASKQGKDGDFGSSESDAQVIVALCALGFDPASDSRFTQRGYSALSAMCSYYADGASKGFKHTKDGDYNQMATEQGYYALTAYERFKEKQTALYDMSDVCAGQHSYGDWTVTKTASCTENGSRSRTCTKCDVVETEEIAVLGHQMTKTPAKAPTCTAPGNNEYYTCSRCKNVFKDAAGKTATTVSAETLTATGHKWTNATCTAPETCRNCGLTEGTARPHSYGANGICSACGTKNPLAKIDVAKVTTVDDSKVSAANAGKIIADNSGLVVKTSGEVTLEEIKAALENGSTVIKGDAANTKEIPSTSNGTAELTALAKTLSGEQEAEVEKLAEKLTSMQKVEMVLDLSVSLQSASGTDLAELTELPAPITVTIPISNEMYQRLQGKTVVILRSHTDVSGDVAVTELAATLGGTGGNYFVQFASDKFSTFALTSYEKVGGGHHGGTVTPVSVKSASTGDAGVVIYFAMGAMSYIGSAAWIRKRKDEM